MGYRDNRARPLGDASQAIPEPPDQSDSDGLLAWIRQQTADYRAMGARIQVQAQDAKVSQGYAIQNGDSDSAAQFAQLSSDAAANYNTWNTGRNMLDSVNSGLAYIGLPGLGVVPYIIGGIALAGLVTLMYAVYQHYSDTQQQLDALKSGALTGEQYVAATQAAQGAGGIGGAFAGIVGPVVLLVAGVYFLPRILEAFGKRRAAT